MSVAMPETPNDMLQLPGVTKANFDKYGMQLLDITVRYSARKCTLLFEHEDNIEDFSQPGPSTSMASTSKRAAPVGRKKAVNKTVSQSSDGWINMDSQDSPYFRPGPARKAPAAKKKPFNFGAKAKTKARKSITAARKKNSPKKPAASRKPAGTIKSAFASSSAATKAKPKASSNDCIGFMPMPMPK